MQTRRTRQQVLLTEADVKSANLQAEQYLQRLLQRAKSQQLVVANPSPAWIYGKEELWQLVQKIIRRGGKGFREKVRKGDTRGSLLAGLCVSDDEIHFGIKGFYSCVFQRPEARVLRVNEQLTKAVMAEGGDRVQQLIAEAVQVLRRGMVAAGVCFESEARILVKGSTATTLTFCDHLQLQRLGKRRPEVCAAIGQLVQTFFGGGDLDLDVLVCPDLPDARWQEVHAIACKCAAVAVAWLARRLPGRDLARRAARHVPSWVQPSTRRSFVIQRAFEAPPGPVPSGGLQCVKAFVEVASFPGEVVPQRLPLAAAYASSNELHFMNGPVEVNFSLFRTMLAFRLEDGVRAHAELMDVSIPHKERSPLAELWAMPSMAIPDERRFPGIRVATPGQQLATLRSTIAHTSQEHKAEKRNQRFECLSAILCMLYPPLWPAMKARALALGAREEDLCAIPSETVIDVVKEGAECCWADLAAIHRGKLEAGWVYWL